jgi:enterochelin esterase-like enzyme
MHTHLLKNPVLSQVSMTSVHLKRDVTVDFYLSHEEGSGPLSLLLVNDGQDLPLMKFENILKETAASISPVLCVAIHCGADRKLEYGTAACIDYMKRGIRAPAYNRFILDELLPLVKEMFPDENFHHKAYAGFSLGGLTALDMTWHYPAVFNTCGVFSGSLWWRTKDLKKGYDESRDRIMHRLVREGRYHNGLRFYFTTGSLDETADRNNNGIIDSIDDTLALIQELELKGYQEGKDIAYINYEDGRHDVETWGRAFPDFLKWAFSPDVEASSFESC